jgi:cysteine desulfurase/selenocysteine lyase
MFKDNSASARSKAAPDWTAVRKEFPTTAKLTFLNSGMKVILPRCVAQAMQEWIDDVYDTAGETAFAMAEIEEARAAVAQAFGAPKEDISLIKNTSEGVSIIAQGFPWREGDNVVLSDIEHENNTFPWRYLEARGVETRFARPDPRGRVTTDISSTSARASWRSPGWPTETATAPTCPSLPPSAVRAVSS